MIEDKDLRAAVQRGLITEAQAAGLVAIADSHRQARTSVGPSEEPFVLFKGFNEIFIVVGLSILFAGWIGLGFISGRSSGSFVPIVLLPVTLFGLGLLQRYFTLKRRMIAPSIALSIMFALTAKFLGVWLAHELLGLNKLPGSAFTWGIVAVVMGIHYRIYRVPFDALIIATAVFSVLSSGLATNMGVMNSPMAILHMSSHGPIAVLSIAFGLACFFLAMRFDMSDPHRVSTRSSTGFWLHVSAAPAIINTIGLNLMVDGGVTGQLLMLVVLLVLAVVAIVIDRRSFLISGAVYACWLIFSLFSNSAVLMILILGLGLVLLGALWDNIRASIMNILPDFPGKDRLPPYGKPTHD